MLSETQKTIPSPSYAPSIASHLISQRGWRMAAQGWLGLRMVPWLRLLESWRKKNFPNGLPNNSVVLLCSGTNIKCKDSIVYAMDWLECEHKMREWLPMVQVCPLFPIFPVDGGGSVYKIITDIGKWFQVYYRGDNKALVDAWTVNITLMRQQSRGASSLTPREEYTLASWRKSGRCKLSNCLSACSSPPLTGTSMRVCALR